MDWVAGLLPTNTSQSSTIRVLFLPDVAFTGEGKLVRKATGYEQEKLEAAIPHRVLGLREPRFRHPLERIGDPQISPTRQK